MKTRAKSLTVALAIAATVCAQEEPKFTVKPTGRILFDAAYVNPQHQEDKLNSGAGIPDMRICGSALAERRECCPSGCIGGIRKTAHQRAFP